MIEPLHSSLGDTVRLYLKKKRKKKKRIGKRFQYSWKDVQGILRNVYFKIIYTKLHFSVLKNGLCRENIHNHKPDGILKMKDL